MVPVGEGWSATWRSGAAAAIVAAPERGPSVNKEDARIFLPSPPCRHTRHAPADGAACPLPAEAALHSSPPQRTTSEHTSERVGGGPGGVAGLRRQGGRTRGPAVAGGGWLSRSARDALGGTAGGQPPPPAGEKHNVPWMRGWSTPSSQSRSDKKDSLARGQARTPTIDGRLSRPMTWSCTRWGKLNQVVHGDWLAAGATPGSTTTGISRRHWRGVTRPRPRRRCGGQTVPLRPAGRGERGSGGAATRLACRTEVCFACAALAR